MVDMFRSLRYCNSKAVKEYHAIISGQRPLRIDKVNVSNEKGASLNLSVAGAKFSGKTTLDASVEESLLYDYETFENALLNRDDFFDACMDDVDFSTLPQGAIIKFQSNISIPQEFDIIQLFEQFKPMLLGQANTSMDADAYAFLEASMQKDDIKIPVFFELDDLIGYSKLDSKYLLIDYTELEEYENEDIIVLAKVFSRKSGNSIVYDPLKDFIKINRAMRRMGNINTLPKELDKIQISGDALSLEVIALYQ